MRSEGKNDRRAKSPIYLLQRRGTFYFRFMQEGRLSKKVRQKIEEQIREKMIPFRALFEVLT
jgi:hypothetical protein